MNFSIATMAPYHPNPVGHTNNEPNPGIGEHCAQNIGLNVPNNAGYNHGTNENDRTTNMNITELAGQAYPTNEATDQTNQGGTVFYNNEGARMVLDNPQNEVNCCNS